MYNNKTKTQLLEIIKQKEDEILDLKDDLRALENCTIYENITDEIKDVYDKLCTKGFKSSESLEIVQTMISSGQIPARQPYRPGVSYRNYR